MMNRYLEDRAREMDMRRGAMRDKYMGDNRRDYAPYSNDSNYGQDYRQNDYYYGSRNQGTIHYENNRSPFDGTYDERRRDYASSDMRRDYSMDYKGMEEDYHKDLEKWIKKLQKKDRIGISEKQVIDHAKQMGVKFNEFDEKEFYAVYLMLISDHKSLNNDVNKVIVMAKEWLEDDDVEREGSEKLCTYMYKIVKGE